MAEMKKSILVGIFAIALFTLPSIISTPVYAYHTQYTGEIIIEFIIGKYTTIHRSFNSPFRTINVTCENKKILVFGLEWYKPPGYSIPEPRFFIHNNMTSVTITNFFGVCRFHRIIGIAFPDNL